MRRFVCIHGHFYQPPREDPATGAVAAQPTAQPWHDWNERVNAECYRPNLAVRPAGAVEAGFGNYRRISFDFGPTLLAWLAGRDPETYQGIIDADRAAASEHAGHGPALAMCYNHVIMPLANTRDKRTQVVWGLRDFEFRFGRRPEGMWLPETAVDLETLDIMAGHGVRFTVLAPHQARRYRVLGAEAWQEGRIDPSRAYTVRLVSGRRISVFFYDQSIAGEVAFGELLRDGSRMAERIAGALDGRAAPQLVSIATDGETFGHHHRFGEMALAECLRRIEALPDAQLTNFGEFLERNPPYFEVELQENTSWSCSHGVERWRSDCGDNTGAHPDWNQAWRAPLREALDRLRDQLAQAFEQVTGALLSDPWTTRDDYVGALLEPELRPEFIRQQAGRELDEASSDRVFRALEMQRMALLMYTSCGWFFDDISGLEAVQNLRFAAHALRLARDLGGEDLEPGFVRILASARSNVPEYGTGAGVYERLVRDASTRQE